jgi:response regulator RpfG family c-di-GMP phosphodiesterase
MIAHHHDHYDGSGLHQTISGKNIPLGARILAVADALRCYDIQTALTVPQCLSTKLGEK